MGVVAGATATQQLAQLPAAPWLISLSIVLAGLLLAPCLRLVGGMLLGFLLSCFAAWQVIDDRLSTELEGEPQEFSARVIDFPASAGAALRLVVEPLERPDLPRRVRLSWYDAGETPRIGEHWQFAVRLRAPRGFANPQGFDYEAWLFRQRIGATGYIVSGKRSADQPVAGLTLVLRRHFLDRVHALFPDDAARAVLTAITIGARQNISREQWEKYARSGTSHLMAISGLHVGLAAAGLYLLLRIVAAPFAAGRNIRDLAVLGAAIGAGVYALLSGLAVPAQRALLMVMLISTAMLLRRQLGLERILALACLAVFSFNPLSLLAAGFQLSFLAVAVLLWSAPRISPVRSHHALINRLVCPLVRLSLLQFALLFGLLPLTVLHFGRIAWLAPFINLLVLPVFNLCTVPLALAAFALDGPLQEAGDFLLQVSYQSIRLVLRLVDIGAALPFAELSTLPMQGPMLVVLWACALWALLPPGFPGRYLAWLAAFSVILYRPPAPPAGCVDIQVLDVGQGLSVVARTRTRIAVFDTGPAFRSGSDTAALVLIPYLETLGIRRVDTLIVSHADLDHAGGVDSLLKQLPVNEILYGESLSLSNDVTAVQAACHSGMSWQWDGVDFQLLHPDPEYLRRRGNNASCVLEIRAGDQRVLLTGDIESAVEHRLVAQGLLKPVELVVVPHHGSRTSSSSGFVAALAPRTAVVSAGFDNRWGFPRPEVTARWRQQGGRLVTTAASGAVSQRFCESGGQYPIVEQRRMFRRYWHAAN